MAKMDYDMPPAPKDEGEETEVDFGFEDAAPEGNGPDLSGFSDDELIAEMKKRGFEYDEGETSEQESEEESAPGEEEVDMSMFEA